jgi:hypothetical protein
LTFDEPQGIWGINAPEVKEVHDYLESKRGQR